MKNQKGFISTSLVITIIMLVSSIIFLMLERYTNNRDLTNTITTNTKQKLADAKFPNCNWGASPYLNILPSEEEAISSIILSCTHIGGISTDLSQLLTIETANEYFTTMNEENNAQEIILRNIKVLPVSNGYKIIIGLMSNTEGKYRIQLKKDKICTESENCNQEKTSQLIVVVKS